MTAAEDSPPSAPPAPGPGGTVPWLAGALALVVGIAAPGLAAWAAPGLFLASALVLGLPHGAADPWVPQWATGQRWTTLRPWGRFLGFYLVAVAGTLATWRWVRPEATAGFLLLTAWHWGARMLPAPWSRAPGDGWPWRSAGDWWS